MNCLECRKVLTGNRRKFCCNKCKDRYHNKHNPRGYYSHLADSNIEDWADDEHPFSTEALGQD